MPFARINGALLHYRVKGSGIPIVFIHPPLLSGSVFDRQLKELSSRYQVILFDIRGHGQSEAADRKLTYSLIAEDVAALLDELEIKKAYICGYSSGGSIAMEAMLSYPERFYGGILIGGLPAADTFIIRSEIWAAASLTGLFRAKWLVALVIAWGNADRPATFKRLFSTAIQGNVERMHEYFHCSLSYSCSNRLQEIRNPVLLLYGDKDTRFRNYAHRMHKGLPNSTLHYLKNVSHQIPTKAADQMNEHISNWIDLQDTWKTTPKASTPADEFLYEPAETDDNQPQVY